MTTTPKIHVLRITDRTGDTALAFSPTDELTQAEVDAAFDGVVKATSLAEAEAEFDKMIGQRFLAYTVPADGSDGDVIRSFDPDADTIVMTPPLVGG